MIIRNGWNREGASSPIATPHRGSRVMRLNSRKDLRIRLEQGVPPSSPASPGSSCSSRAGFSRSCTASPTPGSVSPNAPSSPRSTSSSGSPKCRPSGVIGGAGGGGGGGGGSGATGTRKLSLMAEELEGIRNIYLSPPPSPKLFSNINPQNTWDAFK